MSIDIMQVFHIADDGTRLSEAPFLANMNTGSIWDSILRYRETVNMYRPDKILVEMGM